MCSKMHVHFHHAFLCIKSHHSGNSREMIDQPEIAFWDSIIICLLVYSTVCSTLHAKSALRFDHLTHGFIVQRYDFNLLNGKEATQRWTHCNLIIVFFKLGSTIDGTKQLHSGSTKRCIVEKIIHKRRS